MPLNYPSAFTDLLLDTLDRKRKVIGPNPENLPNHRFFGDLREYYDALLSYGYDGSDVIRHELSHGKFALAVGVVGVRYGLKYFDVETGDGILRRAMPLTVPAEMSVLPNLALAAISAAPREPSAGDLWQMQMLGYPSVECVGERIERWNNRYEGYIIPMPKSVN